MKLPRLKIPTKELPLVALGITSVLVSSLFNISIAKYLVIAMFFGILSKETRWTFWGVIVLVDVFKSFRMLLRTDRFTAILDTGTRLATNIHNTSVPNTTTSSAVESFLTNVGSNPVFSNPVVARCIFVVLAIITAVLWVVSMVFGIGYIIVMSPIICHLWLMLYVFHRSKLKILLEIFFARDPMPEWAGRLVAPYLVQGIAIQLTLGTAIFPLVFYRILKRVGFYKRLPVVHS